MITATVRVSSEWAPDRVRAKMDAVTERLGYAVEREAINLTAYIKDQKLNGQVLNVRTGTLRRSITYEMMSHDLSFRATVGTNVSYARQWELGFSGQVTIREHVVKQHLRMITRAFGRELKSPRKITVREYVMREHPQNVNIKPRPFLRPALEENRDRIVTNIRKAVLTALKP